MGKRFCYMTMTEIFMNGKGELEIIKKQPIATAASVSVYMIFFFMALFPLLLKNPHFIKHMIHNIII